MHRHTQPRAECDRFEFGQTISRFVSESGPVGFLRAPTCLPYSGRWGARNDQLPFSVKYSQPTFNSNTNCLYGFLRHGRISRQPKRLHNSNLVKQGTGCINCRQMALRIDREFVFTQHSITVIAWGEDDSPTTSKAAKPWLKGTLFGWLALTNKIIFCLRFKTPIQRCFSLDQSSGRTMKTSADHHRLFLDLQKALDIQNELWIKLVFSKKRLRNASADDFHKTWQPAGLKKEYLEKERGPFCLAGLLLLLLLLSETKQ